MEKENMENIHMHICFINKRQLDSTNEMVALIAASHT